MNEKDLKYFIKRHNYLTFSFLALFLSSILLFLPKSPAVSLQIAIILSCGFLLWSLVHHYYDKSLSLEIMIEYILTIALVLVSVVYFLL